MSEAKELINKWLEKDYHNLDDKEIDMKYNIYWNAFNVLEDQRIESQISKSYLGHKDRFEKTRYNLGKAGFGAFADFENPVFALLAIRFMRDDIVKNTQNYYIYKKALEDVEETDRFGALRVLISIKK